LAGVDFRDLAMNRLERIQQRTGRRLDSTEELFELWWAVQRHRADVSADSGA
jgi:DNA-binding PucR family transcriptional regulator